MLSLHHRLYRTYEELKPYFFHRFCDASPRLYRTSEELKHIKRYTETVYRSSSLYRTYEESEHD